MRLEQWLYTIPLRLRSLFRRDHVDQELDEELLDHIERQTEYNVARGMRPDEARRAALIALGGIEKRRQECRETRGVHWLEGLGRDLVYALRAMRRNPGFTAAVLLIISLAIGANTAILSADSALLFRVLPYKEPGQLVEVFQKSLSGESTDRMPVAPANFFDWQKDGRAFEGFGAWQTANFNLSGGDSPERVVAAKISDGVLGVLGVEPMLGRAFQSGEDAPGNDSVVILSYGLWKRRYGGSRNVLGKTIRANDRTFTVVGIMPEGFRFPIGWVSSEVEIWTPLAMDSSLRSSRKDIILDVVARLRPGVSLAQAQASLEGVAQQLAKSYPDTNKDWGVNLMPLADRGVSDFRGLFVLLSIAVGLVLLVACANVANLMLVRGMERQKEFMLRTALGARKGRLVRQLVTEGVLLSIAGGLLGIGLGYCGTRALAELAPTMELPDLEHAVLNARVLAVALGLSLATGLLFSILPALSLSGISLQGALRENSRSSSGTVKSNRLKASLVVAEIALTLALLLCAGDILNSFFSYMSIDPGFDVRNVLTMRMSLSKHKYDDARKRRDFFNAAVEELASIPGVSAAAAGSGAPMEETGSVLRFHIAGSHVAEAISAASMAEYFRITPDYFRATGITLVRGRGISPSDSERGSPVAMVNETFARKKFGSDDPIGKRIFLDGDVNASAAAKTAGPPLEIVGVVRDTKEYGLFQMTPQTIYAPMAQDPEAAMSLLVKTTVEPGSVAGEIRRRLAKLDPDQPVYGVRSLTDVFNGLHAFFRFNAMLLAVFAAMALVLSLIGIYGVMAYAVNQRTREFGIRLALGSPQNKILGLVLRQGAWMSLIGLALGLAISWPATRLLARVLKESMYLTLVKSGMLVFPALCCAMTVALALACLLPAWRATKADPMEALRAE
ncbi:MAG: ABC transporter permease [Terracidiphilus sp.]